MSKIIWKPLVHNKIIGESGYLVSNTGLIKRLERRIDYDEYYIVYKEKIIKPSKHITGYLNIKLQSNSLNITDSVHRLVAYAFIPNPNNHINNLEWTTYQDNMIHYANLELSTYNYPPLDISKLKNYKQTLNQFNINQSIPLKIYDSNNEFLIEVQSKSFLLNSEFLTKSQYRTICEKFSKNDIVKYRGFIFETKKV